METLFGHLVTRFGSQQAENLATEGLHYILTRSFEARRLFVRLLEQSGAVFEDELHFVTQDAKDDGAIPDLVALDKTGRGAAIIESKFWAGLTERQPKTYLSRLDADGLLLFIAPSARFESLWPELLHRCREGAFTVADRQPDGTDWRCIRLDGGQRMALTSWRSLLDSLHLGLVQAGELNHAADVLQLSGLASRMDSDAFLPIRSEELSPLAGKRIVQLCELVDRTVDRLKALGLADTKGCRSSGGKHGTYSQFFYLHNCGFTLFFDPQGWAVRGVPITLRVCDNTWNSSPEVNDALLALTREIPPRAIIQPKWGAFLPLRLKTEAEKNDVIGCLVDQIQQIADRVRGLILKRTSVETPPSVETPDASFD